MITHQVTIEDEQTRILGTDGSLIDSNELGDLLTYLVEGEPKEFKVFWDLDTSVAIILRLLDTKQISNLYDHRRISILTEKPYARFTLTYNSGKVFTIRKGHKYAIYYGLKPFFNGEPEPAGLVEAQKLGDQLLDELETVNIEMKRLSSTAAVCDFIFDELNLPTHNDIPDEACQIAWQCSGRPWTEAHKLGHFDTTYDYDIVNAYPAIATQLLDTRHGEWWQSSEYQPTAVYGFCEGRVKIKAKVHPISYLDGKGELLWPNGSWNTWLTKQEIDFIYKYRLGEFKIKDGWWWKPKDIVRPLFEPIKKLATYRQKSPLLNRVIKGGMVSIYGRFLQTYSDGTLAPTFNPVWGAIIETDSRLEVARFILDNKLEDKLILVSTDGCLVTKQVNLEGQQVGAWILDGTSPALSVSSSMVWYGNKRPNQLTYDDVIEMVHQNPNGQEWHKPVERRAVLADIEAVGADRLGKKMTVETGFSLPIEHDRAYKILPSNGSNLLNHQYQSKPLRASKLTKPKLEEETLEEEL